jgi:hypothetical protein
MDLVLVTPVRLPPGISNQNSIVAHRNPLRRSAAIIVREFAPIAIAPSVDAWSGSNDTAQTVSAIVPPQGALF